MAPPISRHRQAHPGPAGRNDLTTSPKPRNVAGDNFSAHAKPGIERSDLLL
jgi:hypothetical protein